jgi:hypothetical protein
MEIAFMLHCLRGSGQDNATSVVNPLKPNDLKSRRAVSILKIKIPSKNMRNKPTNIPIIYSIY